MQYIVLILLGTAEFLQTNPEFVEDQSQVEEITCNKDTGGLKAYHSWSRGVFFIVSAGGHIEYWQPLYRYDILCSLCLQIPSREFNASYCRLNCPNVTINIL